MTKYSLQQALKPLCLSAFVLGVRGCESSKSNLELIYGLLISFILFFTATISGYCYYTSAILVLGDGANSKIYFMIFVEVLGFILNIVLLLPISIYIIIGKKYLITVIDILQLQIKILRCERKMYRKLKKFSLNYSLTAWLCFSFLSVLNYILWIDFTQKFYVIFTLICNIILLQQSMIEGQMLAIMHTQRWLFHFINLDVQNINEKHPNIPSHLTKLRKIHSCLCSIEDTLNNSMFGFMTLISLISIFFGIVNSIYFIFLIFFDLEKEFQEQRLSTMIYDSSWILFYQIRLIFLAFIAQSTTDQAREAQNVLRQLEFKTSAENIRNEISVFAMQLLHCPAPHYSVLGLFPLDLTMLTSINAAIGTYMVILLQFHINTSSN